MKKLLCLLLCAAVFLAGGVFLAGCAPESVRDRYVIEAEYVDGTLSATMQFTYTNRTETELTALPFNLYGNAFRAEATYPPVSAPYVAKAYYDGRDYGQMQILRVSPCAGWEVGGADENILTVRLEQSLFPGESVAFTVQYELQLAKVDHRTGIAHGAVNLGNFYPILCVYEAGKGFYECEYYASGDPFYSECADYSVKLTAPASYVVAASGETLSAAEDGGNKTYEYRLDNARDFAIVLSENFSVLQGESEGVALRYYFLDDPAPEDRLRLLEECFSYFTQTFGRYPYATYSAVQTGFCYGGMEYPGLTMISDSLIGADCDYTLVHETAHQWWYAAVGSNQLEEAWLDEGLTEYSAVLFFENNPAYGLTREKLLQNARTAYGAYCSVQEQIFGRADTTMNRHLRDYTGEYAYVCIAYDKGMLLFDTLRDALGENRFFAGLRHYYAQQCGKLAATEDLCAAFRNAGATGVIRSFVEGTAVL